MNQTVEIHKFLVPEENFHEHVKNTLRSLPKDLYVILILCPKTKNFTDDESPPFSFPVASQEFQILALEYAEAFPRQYPSLPKMKLSYMVVVASEQVFERLYAQPDEEFEDEDLRIAVKRAKAKAEWENTWT